MRQFEETFAGKLLDFAREAAKAPKEEREGRVADLAEFLGKHIAASKRGPISLEGYVQIVLAVVMFLSSIIGAQRSQERIMEGLHSIEAQLKVIAPVEKLERVPELRLVCAASLRLRTEPSMESRVVGKLMSVSTIIDVLLYTINEGEKTRRTRAGWLA